MKNIIILYKKKKLINLKTHYILNYIENINYFDSQEAINFIKKNKKNKLIFYAQGHSVEFHLPILKYLNKNGNNNNDIYFFTFDFWYHKKWHDILNEYFENIFCANNHKVITFCNNLEQLNFFHNFDYSNYKNNIIFNNIWCCYDNSFCDININPLKKILISGAISNEHYPERFILNNFIRKNKYICKNNYNKNDLLKNTNNYSLTLNKYFACFSSSVYVEKNLNDNKFLNTHIILLKTFEILASGSLLVMPKKEEEYLKKYGLIHNENCYLLDFSKNIIEQINYIFNNIDKYNIVREKGQKLAKQKFTCEVKVNEIKKILNIS